MDKQFDIIVIGGGLVGLSVAFKIQQKTPSKKILLIEKENELSSHQSGRNSGVIHSGLYYKPGSLKAKNCVKGRKQLIHFAKKRNVNFDICGKIVVATNDQDALKLEKLKINGEKNGLKGLKLLTPSQFKKIEPNVEGIKALWVPESGIIDYQQLT